jgi:hypothetical protein
MDQLYDLISGQIPLDNRCVINKHNILTNHMKVVLSVLTVECFMFFLSLKWTSYGKVLF